ncbi:MAG: aldehyde dehydrogenase family protein [Bdellovibrionales bacterium]|nr:aldehyde dehydrogenase family protein [Bdellovibrionales bacterium]
MQWLAGQLYSGEFDLTALMSLVKNIQSNKTQWADKSGEDRLESCKQSLVTFKEHKRQLAQQEAEFLSVPVEDILEDVDGIFELIESHLQEFDDKNTYPRGVMLTMLPKTYGLCSFLYMSVLGSLYGNSMIIKLRNSQKLIELVQNTELASNLSVLSAVEADAFEMLNSHPFLDSVVFMGQKNNFNPLSDKHIFASFDAINTHVVLKNADVQKAAKEIFKAFVKNKALSPFKPHRVLVAKAQFEEFKGAFMELVSDLTIDLPAPYKDKFDQDISEVKKDTHNLMYEAPGVYITSDLTYCSTYQEKEVLGGFLSISEFKYNHEAAKWINVSSRHRSVSVWTEEVEKAEKFMSKLHAPKVLVNQVQPKKPFLPLAASGDGAHGGVIGQDIHPQDLFAQKRIIEYA